MNIITEDISFAKDTFTLTNQRVLYWKSQECLIFSDIHIGKTAHFRQHGIAISDNVLQKDLKRLELLISHFNPKQIFIVGDLFHANYNSNIDLFKTWLYQYKPIEKHLIRGNHDRFSKVFYEDMDFKVHTELKIDTLNFIHDLHQFEEYQYYISGHTHPGVALRLKGRQVVKLPCFHVNKQQLVLPAFSLFTGLNTNCDLPNGKSYAFDDDFILDTT